VIHVELTTFGAVVKFALGIEAEVSSFYESAIGVATDPDFRKLLERLFHRGQKRIKTLMRVRRENVTEMILEPIAGLDSEVHKPVIAIPEGADDGIVREAATALETKLHEFYMHAAAKIDFLSEAAYALELLADANSEAAQSLRVVI
jgi:rubrerythrin